MRTKWTLIALTMWLYIFGVGMADMSYGTAAHNNSWRVGGALAWPVAFPVLLVDAILTPRRAPLGSPEDDKT